MKIQEALELAKTCELETVGEAILNVKCMLIAYLLIQKCRKSLKS